MTDLQTQSLGPPRPRRITMMSLAHPQRKPFARRRTMAAPAGLIVLLLVLWGGPGSANTVNGPVASAQREFEEGHYREAAALLGPAAEKDGQDAFVHHLLGRCEFELHHYDRAVTEGEHSVRLDPNNSEYHLWLARAYGRKAEQAGGFSGFSLAKKSRREFEDAVRLNPTNFGAQQDLIEFYAKAPGIVGGGKDKARQQIDQLAVLDAAEAHAALGNLWVEKKNMQQAEKEFDLVIESQPKRIDRLLDAADFYRSRNNASKMEQAVKAAARREPSDRRLSYYRGMLRILAGDGLEEAESSLKTYLETVPERSDYPPHNEARAALGNLYARQGRNEAAAEMFRAALEQDPHNKALREALRQVTKRP